MFCEKKVFLEISQNSQENTCARVTFLVNCRRPATLLKKKLWNRCFPVNFPKFLGTLFLQNNSGRLLLKRKNTGWLCYFLYDKRSSIDLEINLQAKSFWGFLASSKFVLNQIMFISQLIAMFQTSSIYEGIHLIEKAYWSHHF